MQKPNQVKDHILLPIPAELAEELGLDAFATIQYSISRGRLIIEPVDEEDTFIPCHCCHCPDRDVCEDCLL